MDRNCWTFIAIAASALILAREVTIAQTAADENLIGLAKNKFGDISSEEERKVFEIFFQKTQDGETADLNPGRETLTDPVYADRWGRERIIQAG